MKIETLRLFVEVANRLSFAAVAEKYQIDPSSVSRSIGLLEDHLGIRLFNRTTRIMTLTEAGHIYLSRAASIVEEFDHAQEQVLALKNNPTGSLRLTASVAFGESVLIPLIQDFNELYPQIKLELLFTDENLDLVSNGVDLAVRLAPSLSGDLVTTRLIATKYILVASPEYIEKQSPILCPVDVKDHYCTVLSLAGYRNEWLFRKNDRLSDEIKSVSITAGNTVSSVISIRSLVRNGSGPALLANWLVDEDIKKGTLVDVLPAYDITATDFNTFAWAVYPNRAYLPQKVRVMIDFLKSKLSSE